MSAEKTLAQFDPDVRISDFSLVSELGDATLVGEWFVFVKPDWLARSGMEGLLAASGIEQAQAKPVIFFRGEEVVLPGAQAQAKKLPRPHLVSLTSDKMLYRVNRDTVRLLLADPQHPNASIRLRLRLSSNPHADYPVTLDEYGLCLWSMQGLPEGEYEAVMVAEEGESAPCRFEVAEYRLAPLNAELTDQQLSGDVLRYTLTVTAFGQPYSGPIEVELQERGQRVGKREKLNCNHEGICRGSVKLTGQGPYTLNLFVGERTATIALKGSEQERRETLVISALGEERLLSLLPLPQSNQCRSMYITRGASNTQPFLVRRVIGSMVEITARVDVEMLRVVVVNPARGTYEQALREGLKANSSAQVPIPEPYGVVLLGAFIADEAWEGWCAVLRPSEIQLQCEAPAQAKPGERVTITLKTGMPERVVPVQVIVKDQRLISPSDPQLELAVSIKKNLASWRESAFTGKVERELRQVGVPLPPPFPPMQPRFRAMATTSWSQPATALPPAPQPMMTVMPGAVPTTGARSAAGTAQVYDNAAVYTPVTRGQAQQVATSAPVASLAKIRLQFPEVVHNTIVKVQGETRVEVKLGDSMTRYTIEAFALSPETMDWQRVETTLEAVQPVYGELTVSPFVFPGDPVMGRLDVGAASGSALVEVRHDGEVLPLFSEDGSEVTAALPVPSGSVLRFPVRPGAITATVRDARKGGIDVSERYVTEPGKLRHITRHLRLLTPGDEVTLQDRLLEITPLPGLERPFQFFVEGAAKYPFGCIQQTSAKVLAMYTGYITNQDNKEVACEYEAAILVWYKRLKSMYLPRSGFCLYPPEEGGERKPDTYCAPLGVKHLLNLPTAQRSGLKEQALREMLDDIRAMASDAAKYYKLDYPPQKVSDCHAAYQVLANGSQAQAKSEALAYVRSRLREHDSQTYVEVPDSQPSYRLWGMAVSTREETAYATAALLAGGEPGDLPRAIAATNYLTGQLNEEGRLYSTVDTAACLALMLGLRAAGVVTTPENGRVTLNGQEMSLAEALAYEGKVETLRAIEGVVSTQLTSAVIEDWSAFKSNLQVEVRLERKGHVQNHFKVGDALDLVISVPRYEPGLIAHVCLPDALARVVGGGQVKRFSLDFTEKSILRVPLAAVGSTVLPQGKDGADERSLLHWLGIKRDSARPVQHWAVIVRNMFKEEQVGSPGLLEVSVE